MFSRAQSQQKRWLFFAWQSCPVRSLMNPSPTSPTAATSAGLVMRALHRAELVLLRLRRAEELGDDLDREPAGDPAGGVGHRRVLGLALEQVGEGVAHDVLRVEHRAQRRV